jgi:membrane protein required for colicin V production
LEKHVSWEARTIQITAFVLTFVLVVVSISVLAKSLTTIANFASLGLINKLLGGFFGLLKTILILSITLNLFQKLNSNHNFVSKETMDKSLFYNPIQKVSKFVYPTLEKWFEETKSKISDSK